MLPFKTSSVYKIEPRRDFMVTQRSVSRDQPKRTSEFYDIGNNNIVLTIQLYYYSILVEIEH